MIAVLFACKDSIYKTLPDCDVWDIERDARNWNGVSPVIAHPPCRAWGTLKHMAKPLPGERELALFAVEQVRKFGGVLEHPNRSALWPVAGLPGPGRERDKWGGWALPVFQHSWGHKAKKATLLYIVGCQPMNIPEIPLVLGEATHIIGTSGRNRDGSRLRKGDHGWRPETSKREREQTPIEFAKWLVELATRCKLHNA